MTNKADLTNLRNRIAEIQEALTHDVGIQKERVDHKDFARALTDVFGFIDELAGVIAELQHQVAGTSGNRT